jgi:hypothetical protein
MIAIEKLVLIIIFLIILAICIYALVGIAKPSGEQINIQNQIRECCTIYRAFNCDPSVTCGDSTLTDLISKISMTPAQLKVFCGC